MNIDTLVTKLQKANWAYHNTDTPLMTDDEYDASLEELRRLSPAHPFLRLVGASPTDKGVLLPYTMASLDKVRFGEEGLSRWLRRGRAEAIVDVVIMEKLDGLSALITTSHQGTQKLYLRGDGVKGVDVSPAIASLRIPRVPGVIRGEILLPTKATPEGSIGRSLVNGWLHRLPMPGNRSGGVVPEELKNCHFVAYQVLEPAGLTRSQQLTWLRERGYRVPKSSSVRIGALNNDSAKELLVKMKEESLYPIDGIVLGFDTIPLTPSGGEANNPEDAVAFKASLDDQKAETTIISVEWNLSRQNFLIPRIQIQPVVIGGARIEWLSGHNAAFVEENGLGVGARIIIRRSGDVIPTLDSVIQTKVPVFPEAVWDNTHTHLVQEQKEGEEASSEANEKAIGHALSTLGVEGIGPGLVKKLVEAKLNSVKKVYEATPEALGAVIGAGRGPALKEGLHSAVAKATQQELLIASNLLPRGVGERKLRTLYAIQNDASKWALASLGKPDGWTEASLQVLLASLPKALEWIQTSFGLEAVVVAPPASSTTVAKKEGKTVCFTGCRVKDLPEGWEEVDAVTKRCQLLVVADGAKGKETTKTKKAKELGIPIKTLSEFQHDT